MMGTYGGLDHYHPTCTIICSEEYNISFLLSVLGKSILVVDMSLDGGQRFIYLGARYWRY